MAELPVPPAGPDLSQGVAITDLRGAGVLLGHVGDDAVLLSLIDGEAFAVSATCTHYGAPLGGGLIADGEVRCPWHHACFSLRSGEALQAPAFASLATWRVERVGNAVYVRERIEPAAPAAVPRPRDAGPRRVVIVGGGAAGFAAADRLRALGYPGALVMLSADTSAPYDRPNLSKEFLAGTAPEDWIPLQPPGYYHARGIELHLGCEVAAIDVTAREVVTRANGRFAFDALLLATGAEPVRLPTPGFDRANVFVLRSLDDARDVIAAASGATSAVLVGAGFIGLEAAAALRARGLDVHVVMRDAVPMARILGPGFGRFLLDVHRQHGVVFHTAATAHGFDGTCVQLDDGTRIRTDLVIVSIGVKPRTALAEAAGLAAHDGIVVDEHLQTPAHGIFAAGDVARFPLRGAPARVEHWVHAQRQGQLAAANLLGEREVFDEVPFFWTQQHDVQIRYTGHATHWDEIRMDGDLGARDCTVRYLRDGRLLAAASIGRDLENLAIEAELRGHALPARRARPVAAC